MRNAKYLFVCGLAFLVVTVQAGQAECSPRSLTPPSRLPAQSAMSMLPQVNQGSYGVENALVSCSDICVADDGSIYSVGTMMDTQSYQIDPVLVKWDVLGNPVWTSVWNRSEECRADDLAVHDSFVYILMTGFIHTYDSYQHILAKWDQNGSILWFSSIGMTEVRLSTGAIATDSDGFVYALTANYHIVDSRPLFQNVLMKLSPEGSQVWNVTAGGSVDFMGGFDMCITENGTLFTNHFNSSVICKWDTDGNLLESVPWTGLVSQLALDLRGFLYSSTPETIPSQVSLRRWTQDLHTMWEVVIPAWENEEDPFSLMSEDVCVAPSGAIYVLTSTVWPPYEWAIFQFSASGVQTRNWTLQATNWTMSGGLEPSSSMFFGRNGLLYVVASQGSSQASSMIVTVFNPEGAPIPYILDTKALIIAAGLGILALAILVGVERSGGLKRVHRSSPETS